MKSAHKAFSIGILIAIILWNICPAVSAMEPWASSDQSTDFWKAIDILIARPLGIGAGILGAGIFVLSLPFTIPTDGVNEAFDTFIKKPFKFSFTRKCPDEDI